LPRGIDTYIGDRGAKLSGGQRQRLGIARALITKPKILVMDEATSALDNETELAISRALQELHGNTTVILIAHRLTTVKNSDLIIYMEEGKILSTGNFEKIRLEIPNFDTAAKLIGL
jgi:ABC-type bacteriocin/lantibiotic exporter with double-glycine peptidase domain